MILLIGKVFTSQANTYINKDKEYEATLHLGIETSTYDPEGEIVSQNDFIPNLEEIQQTLAQFQGTIQQIPPMYSAKKVNGKKLYELARKGIEIERKSVTIHLNMNLISYSYPEIQFNISCSKGTYIRSIACDFGRVLGCGAYLKKLTRTRCGPYSLKDCLDGNLLYEE